MKVSTPSMVEISGVGLLPQDLIIEILSRLPVKTLCKFRCVSKQWFHLLSDDKSFVSKHQHQSKKNPLLLFRRYSPSDSEEYKANIELTSMDTDRGGLVGKFLYPIGGPVYTFLSCGPLAILCWSYRVCVCNPSTQKFVRLPRSESVSQYCTVGFGHVASKNEYKVVHLFIEEPFVGEINKMGCEIYTLKDGEEANSGSWNRIQDCPYFVRTNRSPVCLNGNIYWMVSDQDSKLNRDSNILCFDLGKQEFRTISYRNLHPGNDDFNSLFLTVYRGSLCLVQLCCGKSVMEIWVLKEQRDLSSTWVTNHSIKLSGFNVDFVFPSEDRDGELLINTKNLGLVYFHIEKERYRAVKNSGSSIEVYKNPCIYYDGFFSPNSNPRTIIRNWTSKIPISN